MIQRKQTLFLLAALILTVIALCVPVATFSPEGMGTDVVMYNLWVKGAKESLDFSVAPLFVLLLITCPLNLLAIFKYNNRLLQAKLCTICMLLLVLYCLVFAFYCIFGGLDVTSTMNFHVEWGSILVPIICILYVMARKGIMDDEKLVKSMDRIR